MFFIIGVETCVSSMQSIAAIDERMSMSRCPSIVSAPQIPWYKQRDVFQYPIDQVRSAALRLNMKGGCNNKRELIPST